MLVQVATILQLMAFITVLVWDSTGPLNFFNVYFSWRLLYLILPSFIYAFFEGGDLIFILGEKDQECSGRNTPTSLYKEDIMNVYILLWKS